MKKNSFIKDSFISIAGVVACKIIGLLYVVPFYAMISTTGGALYSYAYSIYALFLSLSTSGIPAAISKTISEYDTLGYDKTKIRVFKIGLAIIVALGIIGFIAMMFFAEPLAYMLIGDMQGGNTIEDIAFVIRVISTALLIVPLLSVTKGYFQGEKQFKAASLANVIEQIARVIFLLIGCYLILKVFKLDEKYAIGIAVLSATVGAVISYIYLFIKMKKNKELFKKNEITLKKEEQTLTTKYLAKQVIFCAIPFIIIDLLKSAYGMVDALTVVRGMTYLGYNAEISELALSTFTTWGAKLTMIVISISIGLTISLIPNIAADNIKGDTKRVNHKINLSIIALLFITLPMVIGISFLARPIWNIFYSYNAVSIDLFRIFIFSACSFSIYSVIVNIGQTLNHTKQVFITLLSAFILHFVLNIPFMAWFHSMGIPAYHGVSLCTLLTEIGPALYLLLYLKKKHKLNFEELKSNSFKVLIATISMVVVLYLLSFIYKIDTIGRFESLIQVIIYMIVGAGTYFFISYKTGLLQEILGDKLKKIGLRK